MAHVLWPGPFALLFASNLLRERLGADGHEAFGFFEGSLGEGRGHLAAADGMLVSVDHHLGAGGSGRDVEGFVPVAFLDVGFGAVDGLEGGGRAEG